MSLIIGIISFLIFWRLIKKAFESGAVQEILDAETSQSEDESTEIYFEDLFDLRDHEEKPISNKSQKSSTPEKKPVFQEGRGFIFTETSFVSDDDMELEVIEEDENELGGLDSAFIHDALRNDLRTSIVLKEVIEPKYNRRD